MTPRPARRALARLSVAVVVCGAAIVGLSACVPLIAPLRPAPTPSGFAEPNAVAPLAPLVVPRVLDFCPLRDAVHYSGYHLVIDQVFICRGDETHATDGVSTYGPWETAYRIDDAAALLRAYGAPNARRASGACPHVPRDPLIVWVRHDGVTNAYYAPVDACGYPTAAATSAYQDAKRTLLVEVDRGANTSQKDANG